MPADRDRERVQASGLFDRDYYVRAYGHLLAGRDPLEHFLDTGLGQGFVPSDKFDPVLYRVLVPACGSANPLLHCLESGRPFVPGPLPGLFPAIAKRVTMKPPKGGGSDGGRLRSYAKDAAAPRRIPFEVDGREYVLTVPEPQALLARLRDDRPFACARLPHGFWDAAWMRATAESGMAEDPRARMLPPAQQRELATRLCAAIRPRHGGFTPGYLDEVLNDIPVHAGNPDFLRAVAFKGSPTPDEDVWGRRPLPPRDEALRLFAKYFSSGETIYDGMLWKRFLVAGCLGELPALCRGRPVILLANQSFTELGARWELSDFNYLEIPPSLSERLRWDLLERLSEAVRAALARGGRPPVVLTQCGASLAYWLFTRLFARFPRVFYLDLGQALNGWFFDTVKVDAFPWMQVYARTIVESGDFEAFYRVRKGAEYGRWLNSLP